MNEWQTPAAWLPPLVWAAAQVTAVTGAACLAERLARRAGPRAGGAVALAGLAAAAALSLAVFSPWPRWDGPGNEPAGDPAAAPRAAAAAPAPPTGPAAPSDSGRAALAAARAFAAALLDPPREARPAGARPGVGAAGETRRPVRWGLLIAAALLAAGPARFAAGWVQLARLRRRAAPVRDEEATAECAALAAAAGVRGGAELLELDALATAAAVGQRRPAVILPGGWRAWAPADRTAVLAHELAHVAAGDFARNLFAQSLLLVQFYHPLSHFLAARVRANQELAADAAAARLVADRRGLGVAGGRSAYLKSLARLALAADARPGPPPASAAGWPARAFLPSPRRLSERVSMLSKPPVRLTPRRRFAGPLATAGVLAVAGLAAGFRAAPAGSIPEDPVPVNPAPVQQTPAPVQAPTGPVQETPAAPPADAAEVPGVLAYVPADAEFVFTANVKSLMTAPALAPVAAALTAEGGPEGDLRAMFDVGFGDLERVVVYVDRLAARDGAPDEQPPAFLFRTVGEAPEPATTLPDGTPFDPAAAPYGFRRLDARTLAFRPGGPAPDRPAAALTDAAGPVLSRELLTSAAVFAAGKGGGADAGADVAAADVAVFANLRSVRGWMMEEIEAGVVVKPGEPRRDPDSSALPFLRPYRAALQYADAAAVALRLTDNGSVNLSAVVQAPAGTGPVLEEAVRRGLPRLRDDLIRLRGAAARTPFRAGGPALAAAADAARRALDDPTVIAGGDRVRVDLAAVEVEPSVLRALFTRQGGEEEIADPDEATPGPPQ